MFCSDGVCGLIDDDQIEAALRLPDLDDAAAKLVSDALAEGGIDNITVIVADVVETEGTDTPVVLGAAGERTIPPMDGQAIEPADEDQEADDDADEAPPPEQLKVPVDDESRYSPQAPGRRRLGRALVGLLALLLVAGAGLGVAYAWIRTQFYVGAAGERVAIYQGLAESLPAIPLSRVYEVQQLTLAALPPHYQDLVRANIEVPDLASARDTVSELAATAERCATPPPTATPTPSTTPVPSTVTPASPASTSSPPPASASPPTPRPSPSPSGGSLPPEC
jgi:protein phosphatase